MSLRDVDHSIYDPKSHIERDRKKESPFDPEKKDPFLNVSGVKEEIDRLSGEDKDISKTRRRKIMIIGICSACVIFVLAYGIIGMIRYNRAAFSSENVKLLIEGPDRITGNNEAVFIFHIKNDNRIELLDSDVAVNFPQTFNPVENANFERRGAEVGNFKLGTLAPHSERTIEFRGRFKGSREEDASIRATLSYTPKKFSGTFQSPNQKTVHVEASSLHIDIVAPIEAADGDEVEYLIRYKNLGTDALYSMRMKLEYAGSFSITGSDPNPSEGDNVWYIGGLESGDSGTIRVRGILEGNRNEEISFKAVLGVVQGDSKFLAYSESSIKTKIVTSPLRIEQMLNGSKNLIANANDGIRFSLVYKNEGDVALRDVVIIQKFVGEIFDFSKAAIARGSVNAEKKTITWRDSDVPGLSVVKPGQEGRIDYMIPISGNIPITNPNDKNFSSVATVTIDSNDVPDRIGEKRIVGSDRSKVLLNSSITSQVDLVNSENRETVQTPMLVFDKENVFEVHWKLSNLYNDVSGVIASLSIPSGVMWKGFSETSENVNWNERTNKITWETSRMPNGTGILSPVREIVFSLGVTPERHKAGQDLVLMHTIEVTGRDEFTNEQLRSYKEQIVGKVPL